MSVSIGTDGPNSFTVVAVCTGNVCRSPVAERLLSLALGSGVNVSSAGTRAVVGHPIMDSMHTMLPGGADNWLGTFRAQELTEEMLSGADLVLGLSREHRAYAAQLCPAAVRRSFTLIEYARLVDSLGPQRLPSGSLIERLHASVPLSAARRYQTSAKLECDNIADPLGHGEEAYRRAFTEIHLAVEQIARGLSVHGG